VLTVLGAAAGAVLLVGRSRLASPDARGWAALLAAGFVAAVFLEWAAQVLALWDYSALMPTIRAFGHTVGLAPA